MKTMHLLPAGLLLFTAAAASAATSTAPTGVSRLALWITEPIGATSGNQCDLALVPGAAFKLPETPPMLTERDVSDWNRDEARWTLDPARFAGIDGAQKLQDHCFVLAIDGKPVSSGVMLSSYSARLTSFPTISVTNQNNLLDLQLTSSNHGSHMRLIHVMALDTVLGQSANLQRQLQRIVPDGNSLASGAPDIGRRWIAAVQKLIERNQIRQGMPLADVIKHLGPPSNVTMTDKGKRAAEYLWYFDTPMHVNPAFVAYIEDETVRSHSIGSR